MHQKVGAAAGVLSLVGLAFVIASCGDSQMQARTALQGNTTSKVTICHGTASEQNPYVKITISTDALSAHVSPESGVSLHGNNYPDYIHDEATMGKNCPLPQACVYWDCNIAEGRFCCDGAECKADGSCGDA
jgi:hypothetical protein